MEKNMETLSAKNWYPRRYKGSNILPSKGSKIWKANLIKVCNKKIDFLAFKSTFGNRWHFYDDMIFRPWCFDDISSIYPQIL